MTLLQTLKLRWNTLSARERHRVSLIAAALGLAVLWWVLLAPALRTLRSADAEHQRLDAQLQRMQDLQARAQALQAQPRTRRDDAVRALDQTVKQRLGPNAQFNVSGEQATLTLKGVPAESLIQLLSQARINAHATPKEARLTRNNTVTTQSVWDGMLVLALPDN